MIERTSDTYNLAHDPMLFLFYSWLAIYTCLRSDKRGQTRALWNSSTESHYCVDWMEGTNTAE